MQLKEKSVFDQLLKAVGCTKKLKDVLWNMIRRPTFDSTNNWKSCSSILDHINIIGIWVNTWHCLNPKRFYKSFHLENMTEPIFALRPIEVWLAWLNVSLCRTFDIRWWKFRSERLHYLWQCRPIRLLTVWTYESGECCWLGFLSSSRSFNPGQHWFVFIFLFFFHLFQSWSMFIYFDLFWFFFHLFQS